MIDFSTWQKAWEAEMAKAGYPHARLDAVREPEGISYVWTHDINYAIDPSRIWETQPKEAWHIAHACLIKVDHLRPREVSPSLALMAMLESKGE